MGRDFFIRLADLTVSIATLHDETYGLCADYLCDACARPDISLATDQAAIDYERAQDKVGSFSDAYYETLAVYRAIAEQLPRFGRLLVHGSAVAIGDSAWLFMASSGTGKSTHTRWWRAEFASESPYMVNDDKPILCLGADGVFVYGTPWDGKERLSSNTRARLEGVGLLERGEFDHVDPLPASKGVSSVAPYVYRPTGRDSALATMGLLERLVAEVPLFKAHVTNSAHAARVARSTMNRGRVFRSF